MIAPNIVRTRDYPKDPRIRLYDRLRKTPCADNRQARVCVIHETFGLQSGNEPAAWQPRSTRPCAIAETTDLDPPNAPPFRIEGVPSHVAVGFCDRASRRRSRSYGEDLRPSETAQTRGLAVPQ